MSLLRGALGRVEKRDYSFGGGNPWYIPSNGQIGISNATDVPVTEKSALSLTAFYACVKIIADQMSMHPIQAVQADKDGVLVPTKPQPTLISDPFYQMTRQDGLHRWAVSLLVRGNAFGLIVQRDYLGRPRKIMPLAPDSVRIKIRADGTLQYKLILFGSASGKQEVLDIADEDMIHIRGFVIPGNPLGISVLESAKQNIGLGLAAEEYGARFFSNGAVPSAVIEIPEMLTNEKARELRDRIEAKHSGLRRAHRPAVLTAGAQWKQISINPDEAQFIATREYQTEDIARIFGIPPHLIGNQNRDTSWGTGIEQQMLQFMHFTLQPWFSRIETCFSSMLPAPQYAKYDLDSVLKTDTAGRYSVYMQARTMGTLTINEIRAKENMPPIEGGDNLFAPLNSSAKPMGGSPDDPTLPPAADAPTGNSPSGSSK